LGYDFTAEHQLILEIKKNHSKSIRRKGRATGFKKEVIVLMYGWAAGVREKGSRAQMLTEILSRYFRRESRKEFAAAKKEKESCCAEKKR